MEVIKRDGSREPVKIEKILHAVNRACRGLTGVDPLEVAKQTINGLHQGSTTEALDNLSISNAVALMAAEPDYSKVAARMLSENIRKEVGRNLAFRDYLQNASGADLISDTIVQLAQTDIAKIEYAIRHERDDLFEYFGLKTIADRYLLRHPSSRKLLERPQWLFMRVSLGLSQTIEEAVSLYNTISQFLYMPATPTLFNSGTKHPQMSSCYLLKISDDSLEGIYKSVTDCAKLSKFAGGIGIDWTSVRASGALIKGTNGLSNGVIPFLKVFDSSVHAINQGGKRKGAAAVYLEPWHADIEAFLELRKNTGAEERRTHHLNLALWVCDLFMRRVEKDESWSLFSPSDAKDLNETFGEEFESRYVAYETQGLAIKSVSARALFAKMMTCLAETGNGWLCFKDQANRRCAQTGKNKNIIHSSNLCTEILEVSSEKETAVCNLGSLNLPHFVNEAGFDFSKLKKTVRTAVRFLDRVVDINFYPTGEAQASNHRWRPIGLGLMGLQDLFFKLQLPFESQQAQALSARISETIYYEALDVSCDLAQEFGVFPAFEESRYKEGFLQVQLAKQTQTLFPEFHFDWDAMAQKIAKKGLRNSLLIAIAPTATIASIVGSYESIEPQLSNLFKRETLSGEFIQVNRYLINDLKRHGLWDRKMQSLIVEKNGSIQDIKEIPETLKAIYKTVWEIQQKSLIDLAVQRSAFICQSQSLNLFMENPNIGRLSSMYMYAWKQGVKTTYYLRSRAKTSIQKATIISDDQVIKDTQNIEDVSCSLENPDSCEVCQ